MAKPKHAGDDRGGQALLDTRTRTRLKRPSMYAVLLHNDDYTPRMFVVALLVQVFHKSEGEAHTVMMHAHKTGRAVAGVYTREIAETKASHVAQLSKQEGFPLLCTVEPDADDGSGP